MKWPFPFVRALIVLGASCSGTAFGADVVEIYSHWNEVFLSTESIYLSGSSVTETSYPASYIDSKVKGQSNPELIELLKALEQTTLSTRQDFTLDGEKFRTYVSKFDANRNREMVGPLTATFNGAIYRTLYHSEKRSGLMTSKSRPVFEYNPYVATPPMLNAFQFIPGAMRDAKALTFKDLKNKDTWQELLSHSRLIGEAMIEEVSCVVVEINLPGYERGGLAISVQVFFAPELGFYPIRTEERAGPDGVLVRRFTARDVHSILDDDGNEFYVHREGFLESWSAKTGDLLVKEKSEIDIDTLWINREVKQSLFELSPLLATTYHDFDNDVLFKAPRDDDLFEEVSKALGELYEQGAENAPEPSGVDRLPSDALDREHTADAGGIPWVPVSILIIGSVLVASGFWMSRRQ